MRRLALCSLLSTIAWTVATARADDSVYYSISMNDKVIGYATAESSPVKQDGRSLVGLKSTTSLKVAMLGKPHNVFIDSETLLNPESNQPLEYRSSTKTNDSKQHTDCEIQGGLIRVWTYRDGDKKGTPTESKFPAGTLLLGGNNFGHWRLLASSLPARVKGGKADVPAFVSDTGSIEVFDLARGADENISVMGTPRSCSVWRQAKSGMTLWLDARTHELTRFDIAPQQISVTLADASIVKQLEKSRAEEVLAQHFAQSNVAFDNYRKVAMLRVELKAQLIGTGLASDARVLTSPMQKFDGKIADGLIEGVLTIQSQPYEGLGSPPFPVQSTGHADELKSETYIESDDPKIIARSKALVTGATSSWDAVLRVARWVHQNISYSIGDTPSASLCLEKRTGDCGPHATLTVALLRSAGIPARLVGGLMYAPSFGGSFGQHAWVEVHQGQAGWVALDPTTGEYGKIGATHIKLFEGLGGAVPKSLRVLAYEPPNQTPQPASPRSEKPLPWKLAHKYTWRYQQNGSELGTESFSIARSEEAGKPVYKVQSDLNLKVGALAIKGTGTLSVGANGTPLKFLRDADAGGQKYTIECTFRDGLVDEKVTGVKDLRKEIKLPAGAFCFDNNMMACWAIICSQVDYAPGKEVSFSVFHPSSMQILPITIKTVAMEEIDLGKQKRECYRCDISGISNTFWVTKDGKIMRAKQGGMVIELTED